jgi:hypothetical protein
MFRVPAVNTKSCAPIEESVYSGQYSQHVSFFPVVGSVYVMLSCVLSGSEVILRISQTRCGSNSPERGRASAID